MLRMGEVDLSYPLTDSIFLSYRHGFVVDRSTCPRLYHTLLHSLGSLFMLSDDTFLFQYEAAWHAVEIPSGPLWAQ